jgi:hypothetical protein
MKAVKNTQTSIGEVEITSQEALRAVADIVAAEEILDSLPIEQMNAAKKSRADAKQALIDALPVKKKEIVYRVGDYKILIRPAKEKEHRSFDLQPKPSLSFISEEDEE